MKRHAWILGLLGACAVDQPAVMICGGGVLCPVVVDGGLDARVTPDVGVVDRGVREVAAARELSRVEVRPGSAAIVVRDDTPATQDLVAWGTYNDGTQAALGDAVWSVTPNPIATIDNASGRVTAGGAAGGTVDVSVQVAASGGRTLMARGTVTVTVERSVTATGAPTDAAGHFAGTPVRDPSRAPNLLYPLDGAVIPNNLAAPDVQWENGAEGDLYRVRLRKTHVTVTAYVPHTGAGFRYDWVVDAAAWRALLESDPDDPLQISVQRWDHAADQVVEGGALALRVARATLSGTIYYWDLSEGRIQKIDAITAARSVAIPSPPARMREGRSASRCVACHTVSRDGRYLSAELWDGGDQGAVFDLSDSMLSADPAPTVFGPNEGTSYLFSTFSPDSNYLVTNTGNALALRRRATGEVVAGSNLPADHSAHPEWSPDGMQLALITHTNGSWGVDFTQGDLAVAARTAETTFGDARVVHLGASSPGGTVDAHPTYSPDSRWIAFQHGTNSRSGNVDMMNARYPGRVELIASSASPPVAPMALQRANGDGDASSYWPCFSPFNSGGYFWLAFYARRDYGNAQAGTRGSGRRQIWVTAVSNRPGGMTDPSSIPYWLPGQDPRVENMSAFWAPVACRMNGDRCTVSAECCSGQCERQGDGMYACRPPPAAMCRRAGQTCSSDADCCGMMMCYANVCGTPPG